MRKQLSILLLIVSFTPVAAQVGTSETDTELWLKAGAEVKLSDKWELAIEEHPVKETAVWTLYTLAPQRLKRYQARLQQCNGLPSAV